MQGGGGGVGGGGVGGPVDTKNLRWLARFRWRPSRSVGAVRTCAPSMTADRRQSVGGERRDAFPIASLSLLIPVLTVSTSIDAIPFKSGSRSRAPARKRKKKKRKKKTNKQKALASRPRISCADTVAPTPRRQGRNYEQVQITFKLSPDWISANQLPTHTHTHPQTPQQSHTHTHTHAHRGGFRFDRIPSTHVGFACKKKQRGCSERLQ